MKLLICGGRDFNNWTLFKESMDEILSEFPQISLIIHGGAPGADTFAESWSAINSLPIQRYLAQWNRHGRRAGILRNQQMLDEGKPDLVIAFPTGGPGTKHMISIAREAKIEVRIFHG